MVPTARTVRWGPVRTLSKRSVETVGYGLPVVEWSSADIPDQLDRVIVVTGANSGIGLEVARALASARATVVMACRSVERGTAAKAMLDQRSRGELVVMELDLTDGRSIQDLADRVIKEFGRVDGLVNNAGIMGTSRATTEAGIDRQWATNHLGHFALTGLLLPAMIEREARVVNVSSLAAAGGNPDRMIRSDGTLPTRPRLPLGLTDRVRYPRFGVYSDTKWANQVFSLELNHRLAAANSRAIAVAAHPGLTHTNLVANSSLGSILGSVAGALSSRLAQSAEDGALPILRAATDPAVEGGQYYGPSGRRQRSGPPKQISFVEGSAARSHGRELWQRSMTLTGVQYLTGA